jgi:hypothetical protein
MARVERVDTQGFLTFISLPLLTELVSIKDGFSYKHGAPNGAVPKSNSSENSAGPNPAGSSWVPILPSSRNPTTMPTCNLRRVTPKTLQKALQVGFSQILSLKRRAAEVGTVTTNAPVGMSKTRGLPEILVEINECRQIHSVG